MLNAVRPLLHIALLAASATALCVEVGAQSTLRARFEAVRLQATENYSLQQQQADTSARKVDEFGDIQISDWLARLDNFAIELQYTPSSKGFIVAYGIPNKFPGWPLRRANQARGYLVRNRNINAARIAVFNGGQRNDVMFQLWIVEAGAALPVPAFDLGVALAREKTPFLYDQFYLPVPAQDETGIESGYEGYLDEAGRYEPFVSVLRADPGTRGCVIAYATRRNRRGTDRRLAAQQKRTLMRYHSVGADRIVAIGGGLRARQTVELWIVPPGSPLPKPTPARRPTAPR